MKSRDELRDDVVDRAWDDAMGESPRAAVDDAIRAAARRAVGAKPRRGDAAEARGPWRWWMPIAAAATIGAVAIGVIQTMPHDMVEPTVLSDTAPARGPAATPNVAKPESTQPAASASGAAAPSPASAPASPAAGAPAARPVPAPPSLRQSRETAAPAPMHKDASSAPPMPRAGPAPAPVTGAGESNANPAHESAAARAQAPQEQVAGFAKRRDAGEALPADGETRNATGFVPAPPAHPSPAASAPRPQAAAAGALGGARTSGADASARAAPEAGAARPEMAQSRAAGASPSAEMEPPRNPAPPETYIAEIRRRLAAGDHDGAVRELQRFRRAHVDADRRLPEDLRAFAATVPRPPY